jgi:hypothetical protein
MPKNKYLHIALKVSASFCSIVWASVYLHLDDFYAQGFRYLIRTFFQTNMLCAASLAIGLTLLIHIREKRDGRSFEWSFALLLGLSLVVGMRRVVDTLPILVPMIVFVLPALLSIYIGCFLVPDDIRKRLLILPNHRYAGILLFFIVMISYFVIGYRIISEKGFHAGDEIYYMLQAESLVKDGDVNLANNIPYLKFELNSFRAHHISRASRAGEAHTHHPFGLSILLAPGYALGGRWWANFTLMVLSSFLGPLLFEILKGVTGKNQISFFTALIFSLSMPFSIYAVRTYPELLSGIFYLWIFYLIKFKASKSNFTYLLMGFLLGYTYWLLTRRFIIPFTILNLSALIGIFKTREWNKIIYLMAPQIVLFCALFLINSYRFAGNDFFAEGGDELVALGGSSNLSNMYAKLRSLQFLRPIKLLGALFDRRFGLIWTNPFLVLLIPASLYMTVKDFYNNWEAYTIFWGVFILACGTTFCGWPAGVCHQPRYAVAAMPFLAVPCAKMFVSNESWYRSGGIQIALLLSFVSLLALLGNAHRFDSTYMAYTENNHWINHLGGFMPWYKSLIFYDGEICISHIFTVLSSCMALSYLCFSRFSSKINKTSFFAILLVLTTLVATIFKNSY